MNTCPRCGEANLRQEHQGIENGVVMWTMYYCKSCGYSIRDSEPENILVRDKRTPYFNLHSTNPEDYPFMMPSNPRKKKAVG